MRLSILLRDGFSALDIVGGYEVLANMPGAETEFAAHDTGLIAGDDVARMWQRGIEYYPAPPPGNGDPGIAPPKVQAIVRHAEATGPQGIQSLKPPTEAPALAPAA